VADGFGVGGAPVVGAKRCVFGLAGEQAFEV
jgi:hypothetical protein